jgi:hypothetical protein
MLCTYLVMLQVTAYGHLRQALAARTAQPPAQPAAPRRSA